MSLFKFEDRTDTTKGAQQLVPNGTTDIDNPTSKVVNVVNDYAWTIQPKSARKDVPYLYMIERKLTNDVMIQQLIYNLVATFEVGSQIAADAQKILVDLLLKDSKEENRNGLTDEERRDAKKREIEKNIQDAGLSSEDPYTGLYSLEDTGWAYVLPYFDKKNHNIDGSWGVPSDNATGGIISKLGNAATEAIGNIATDVNQITSALGAMSGTSSAVKPGTYIEKAKQYSFQSQGPSYSLSFNLYNTGKITDVIDNWELCFALMYNLLPNRRTKTVFDPPPLYEIYIPGVRRSPVSFIKGMRVDFLGATRLMDLDVAGQPPLRTIVPDAYSIQIDIEDVLPESKNFMQSMIDQEKRVRVSTKDITFSATPAEMVEKTANNVTHITLNPTQRNGTNTKTGETKGEIETLSDPVNREKKPIRRVAKGSNRLSRGGF